MDDNKRTRAHARRQALRARVEHDRLVSPQEAAARLDVCERTIWRWIGSGRLPALRTCPGRGGKFRIRPSDLDALLASGCV